MERGYLRFVMQMCDLAEDFLKTRQLRLYTDRQAIWSQLEQFTRLAHSSLEPRATAYTLANEGRRLIECDRVSLAIEYPVLMQGTGPRMALLDEFRETPHCILFATSSFWQGVDVPGEQLSCVIIDKLPFAVPNDPVVEARIRNVRESGGDPNVWNASGHWGLYQFSASTWAEYGGNPADFGSAGIAEQEQVFMNALAQGGEFNWAPYDGC